jgi:hypothetical protein
MFAQQNVGDEESRDHEEDIDADKSATERRAISVEDQDQTDRDGA